MLRVGLTRLCIRKAKHVQFISQRYETTSIASRVQQLIKAENLEEAEMVAMEVTTLSPQCEEYMDEIINTSRLITPYAPQTAYQIIQEALQSHPTHADLAYQLAMVHIKEKELDQASDILDKVLEHDPEHCPALCAKAIIFTRRKQIDDAETVLHKACSISENKEDHTLHGSILLQYSSLYASPHYLATHGTHKLRKLADLILFDPRYQHCLQGIYVLLYQQLIKQNPAVFQEYERRAQTAITCQSILRKSNSAFQAGEFDDCVSMLDSAHKHIQDIPSPPDRCLLFSQIYHRRATAILSSFTDIGESAAELRKDVLPRALRNFELALRYDQENHLSWVGKAGIHEEHNELSNAIDAYENALKNGHPNHLDLYYKLAVLYRKEKQEEKAIDYAQKVLAIDPEHKNAKLELFAAQIQKNGTDQPPPEEAVKLSESIYETNEDFRVYYEKQKDRDPDDIVSELNTFLDHNVRPNSEFKVYSSEDYENFSKE